MGNVVSGSGEDSRPGVLRQAQAVDLVMVETVSREVPEPGGDVKSDQQPDYQACPPIHNA
jgi:hypothetical protein